MAGFPDPTIPNLNLPNTTKVGVKYLQGGVKASGQLSDHIAVLLKPEGFEIIAEGDTDESERTLRKWGGAASKLSTCSTGTDAFRSVTV